MWASMNANSTASGSSAAAGAGAAGAGATSSNSSAALFSAAPIQTFKFNFSAPQGDEPDAEMGGEGEAAAAASSSSADNAAPVLQRQAVQHRAPKEALAAPSPAEVELLTLHPSSTFTVSPLDDRAAASGAVAAAAGAASASASASAPSAPLQFLKRRSLGAHTALKDMLHDSDLITQVYEGGFKVWECAIDLLLFLQRHGSAPNPSLPAPMFPRGYGGMRVGELGCGHGFPALYCLQRGAEYVALQDYNAEVIETATIDNARLNARPYSSTQTGNAPAGAEAPMSPAELDRHVGFFSGDWSDPALLSMMGRGSYDLLLTSDTLYSCAYMLPLFRALVALLAPGGCALVAAKRYYFGIGGSTMEFCDLVAREGRGEWECTLVDTIEDGKSNIREILLLRRTPQAAAAAQAAATAAASAMQ